MIDRVARAMHTFAVAYSHATLMDMSTVDKAWRVYRLFDGNPFMSPDQVWEGEFDAKSDAHALCNRLNARAAIEAMREPTHDMLAGALKELSGPTDRAPKAQAWDTLRGYRAMIDTALNPQDKG